MRKIVLSGINIVLIAGIAYSMLSMLGLFEPRIDPAPPADLKTIEQFFDWKGGSIRGEGVYTHEGIVYEVLLGDKVHRLSSGYSAYIFDETGKFVDWTPDMGDAPSVVNGFRLMSGNVKNFEIYELEGD